MKRNRFRIIASAVALSVIALAGVLATHDNLSLNLPGDYMVQMSTHYEGSKKMRSFMILGANAQLAAAEQACPAEQTANAVASATSACPAQETANAVASVTSACPAQETANTVASVTSACPADQTANIVMSAASACPADQARTATLALFN